MKIAVFGSREINKKKVYDILCDKMSAEHEYITSGNIDGAAKMAVTVAKEKGIKITLYNYESGLGFYLALKDIMSKNKKMIAACDSALVFWNGESKGTEREINMLDKQGKPYELIICEKRRIF
ncbi:MAG: hypothetical protein LBG96_16640 [Tannerella sp.]|nr:hypothetical protein [Tannerella sp.]